MSYQVIKMIVYVVSVMLSMWSLSCFNFDNNNDFLLNSSYKQN